jgi:hypothetical protein
LGHDIVLPGKDYHVVTYEDGAMVEEVVAGEQQRSWEKNKDQCHFAHYDITLCHWELNLILHSKKPRSSCLKYSTARTMSHTVCLDLNYGTVFTHKL